MNFFAGFFKAIINCFKGIELLFNRGLTAYIFYPLIVWALMWVGSILLFTGLATIITGNLIEWIDVNNIPDSGFWLSFAKPFLTSGYFSVMLIWCQWILFWFLSGTFAKYMTLILLAPFIASLSEAVEHRRNGKTYAFEWPRFLKDIFRGIAISIRNMLLEYFFMVLCFILTLLFPPLIIVTAPFLLLVSFYFTGFTMLDYNFERHELSVSQSVRFTRNNKGLACGIGVVYTLFMALPFFIGLMFGPALAVIGATTSFLDLKEKE